MTSGRSGSMFGAGPGIRARAAPYRAPLVALSMALCYAIALFHRTAFQGIDLQLQQEFALSKSASADLAAVFFWTYLAVMIPVGLAADRWGAVRVAIAGNLMSAAGAVLFSLAAAAPPLALARVLIAAGSAAAFVGMMRFIAVGFPERRATVSGRGIFIGNLGAMASGAPLVLLLAVIAWRDIWLAVGGASLVLACLIALLAPRSGRAGSVPQHRGSAVDELRELLASPSVYIGMLILAGLAGAFYAFGNIIGPRWLAARGFTALDSGWGITILAAGYGTGAAIWGWVGDMEHQRTRALVFACAGALCCWIGFAFLPSQAWFSMALLFFVCGLCCGAFALVYPLIAERHPLRHAGGVIACVNCGIPLGAAVLQMVAGRLADDRAPWLLIGSAGIALIGALLLLRDRRSRMRGDSRSHAHR